jgi:hypothetical protein
MLRGLVLAVADRLTDHRLDIRSPEWERSHLLRITNIPGVMSEISVYDNGAVEWEYCQCHGNPADPAVIAKMAMSMLGADIPDYRGPLLLRPGYLTLRGVIGRALAQRGMHVSLDVYRDEFCFEAYSEIKVTNPARPDRGKVRLTDDNSIVWECRLSDLAPNSQGIDFKEVAETIAFALKGRDPE